MWLRSLWIEDLKTHGALPILCLYLIKCEQSCSNMIGQKGCDCLLIDWESETQQGLSVKALPGLLHAAFLPLRYGAEPLLKWRPFDILSDKVGQKRKQEIIEKLWFWGHHFGVHYWATTVCRVKMLSYHRACRGKWHITQVITSW